MDDFPDISVSLMEECEFGDVYEIGAILDKCNYVDINFVSELLLQACRHEKLNVMIYLIDRYHDVDVTYRENIIFRTACEYGYLDIIVWLHAKYPDIGLYPNHFYEPLPIQLAYRNGHLNVAIWLMENYGYSYSYRDILVDVCVMGFTEFVKWLILCPTEYWDFSPDIALINAYNNYHVDIVKLIIRYFPMIYNDINMPIFTGRFRPYDREMILPYVEKNALLWRNVTLDARDRYNYVMENYKSAMIKLLADKYIL